MHGLFGKRDLKGSHFWKGGINMTDLNLSGLKLDELGVYYLSYRQKIADIETHAKQQVETLAATQDLIADEIKKRMDADGLQSIRPSSGGLIYWTTKTQVRKTDGLALLNFCKERDNFDLMQLTPLKTAVVAYVEETGAVPPGVDYQTFKDLAFRKG